MNIKVNDKEFELKFTFNSFRYMEDFNLNELNDLGEKPFKVIGVTEQLLHGALNHDKKVVYTKETASTILEEYLEGDTSMMELVEGLMRELEESDFFKKLQK